MDVSEVIAERRDVPEVLEVFIRDDQLVETPGLVVHQEDLRLLLAHLSDHHVSRLVCHPVLVPHILVEEVDNLSLAVPQGLRSQ